MCYMAIKEILLYNIQCIYVLYWQQGEAAPESMKFKCANHLRDVTHFFRVSQPINVYMYK
jgi:hypothetical protein